MWWSFLLLVVQNPQTHLVVLLKKFIHLHLVVHLQQSLQELLTILLLGAVEEGD